MDCDSTTLLLAGLFIILTGMLIMRNGKKKLPPAPRGLPILGHLHMIGKNLHQDLYELSKKYGPIMYLRFGYVDNIIVSSPQAAKQFLKTHDLVFASRPPRELTKHLFHGLKNLISSPYGPYWRNMRKLVTLQLLSNLKINSFQPLRREELELLIDSIKRAAKDHVEVDLSAMISSLSADMSCRMVFGKKYKEDAFHERGFRAVIQQAGKLVATPNPSDFFPYLKFLDLQRLTRRMKEVAKIYDEFLEKIIDEHIQNADKGPTKDFVDTMWTIMESGDADFQFDRSHVKAILMDIINASMDTSATAIEWMLSELFKHPQALKKVQEEIKEAVGMDRMVEESDLERLEYLNMVLKEMLRLHPVAPLLLPHEAMKDCIVDGFYIPKNSRVIINVWAIGRDPNVWHDPERFVPERFIGSSVDLRGQDFQLIPFGSGRRSCAGMQLGLIVVRLVVAQLVHCFDWELPNGMLPHELDMTEEFGLVMARSKHLVAIPTYRLAN